MKTSEDKIKNITNENEITIESMENYKLLIKNLIAENEYLKKLVITDTLTNIYNRYFFEKNIIKKLDKDDDNNSLLTLIIFDLDSFKVINDIYGHDVGDEILRKVADIGIKSLGKDNIFARWGGDEFIILSLQTNLSEGYILAENLRKSIEKNLEQESGNITVSLGIAQKQKSESFRHWFKRTDKALYKAKKNGRNCVVQAD